MLLFIILIMLSYRVRVKLYSLFSVVLPKSSFIYPILEKINDAFQLYRKNLRKVCVAFGVSTLSQWGVVLSFYFLALSLKMEIAFIHLFLFIPFIELLSNLPFSYGGIGIREALFVFLFSFVQIPPVDALSLSLLFFVKLMMISLLGGLCLIFSKQLVQPKLIFRSS